MLIKKIKKAFNRLMKTEEKIPKEKNKDYQTRHEYYRAAKIFLTQKNYEESLKNINHVIHLKKDWVGAVAIKVKNLYFLNRANEIECTIKILINNSSLIENREKIFSDFFSELLDYKIENILQILNNCLDFYQLTIGIDDFYSFYKAIIDANTKKLESASINFNKVSNFGNLGKHTSGGASFLYGDELRKIISGAFHPNKENIHFSNKSIKQLNYKSVIFTSCDLIYFNNYFDLILLSFKKNIKNKIFHIHIVNPDEFTLEKLKKLTLSIDLFNYSYEIIENPKKINYACARFIRLNEILKFYKKDVLICDIDAFFIQDFDINNLLENNDISIKVDKNCKLYYYPWRQIAAGFSLFKYNTNVLNFSKDLSLYLNVFADKNDKNYWYIDQSALFCLINHYSEENHITFKPIYKTSHYILFPDAKNGTKDDFIKSMIERFNI